MLHPTNRRHIRVFLLMVFLSPPLFAQTENEVETSGEAENVREREYFLVRDVPRTVDFDYDIGEIAIGNPGIAAVVVDRPKRRMVISPLTVGETAILVFDTRGVQRDKLEIIVTSTDLDQFVKDLKFLFRDIEGLSARRVGSKIVLEGEVYLRRDLDRIEEVLRGNEFVVNLVTLSQDTQRILARRIKNEINISGVEVDTARDRIILKGEVATDAEKERAEKIALIYVGAERLVNVIAVNPNRRAARAAKLIQVNAYFVEVNKSFLRNFNFSWTPIADVTASYVAPSGDANPFQFFAVLTNFLPKLNTAKALGVARVFENPSVSVKSGDSASVKSGSQLILAHSPPDAPATYSAPVDLGVDLGVTPTADERDFVDMKVNVSVRSLGSSPQGSAIPSERGVQVLVNQAAVQTSHYVRSGETVAIGGAIRSAFTDVKDADPGRPFVFQAPGGANFAAESSVGNIFQVFKSRSITHDRGMFIVFITPEVLISARDSSRRLRDQMNLQSVEAVDSKETESFE